MEAHVAVVEEVVLVGARKHRHHHPIVLRQRDPASSRMISLSSVGSVSEVVECQIIQLFFLRLGIPQSSGIIRNVSGFTVSCLEIKFYDFGLQV